ncbi:MAG: hypothetical protein GY845_31160 [Planctomycetes bacterium]|nr:hypothetical protein [Planctomycetota bacterium]
MKINLTVGQAFQFTIGIEDCCVGLRTPRNDRNEDCRPQQESKLAYIEGKPISIYYFLLNIDSRCVGIFDIGNEDCQPVVGQGGGTSPVARQVSSAWG